jgi:hypothetical protein
LNKFPNQRIPCFCKKLKAKEPPVLGFWIFFQGIGGFVERIDKDGRLEVVGYLTGSLILREWRFQVKSSSSILWQLPIKGLISPNPNSPVLPWKKREPLHTGLESPECKKFFFHTLISKHKTVLLVWKSEYNEFQVHSWNLVMKDFSTWWLV